MHNFVILFRLTSQGIKNIKDSPRRVSEAKKIFQKQGVTVKDFFLLFGEYDTLFVVESNSPEKVASACLELGSLGNVRSETFTAFSEENYKKILNDVK